MRFRSTLLTISVMLLAFTSTTLAVDMLYVTLSNNTIVAYDTTSGVSATIAASVTTFASTNLNNPVGLAFDSSGNLYVANYTVNYGSTISKFDSSGTFLISWYTGTATPQFLAFKPVAVPEPSTYALAAIATVVMAYLAVQRKTNGRRNRWRIGGSRWRHGG